MEAHVRNNGLYASNLLWGGSGCVRVVKPTRPAVTDDDTPLIELFRSRNLLADED